MKPYSSLCGFLAILSLPLYGRTPSVAMAHHPAVGDTSGLIPFHVPAAGKQCNTWYRYFKPAKPAHPPRRPIVALHGGPGIPHVYWLPVAKELSDAGYPFIVYDQLGCGHSTHLPEKMGDGKFWTEELFLKEFDNLLKHLHIQNDYDLIGHSWGGMLAAMHAIRQPHGLKHLIIASAPASMVDWANTANKLRAKLPADIQETLTRNEEAGTTDNEEYGAAVQEFYNRFVCRAEPWPAVLVESLARLNDDPTVYLTMNGPSEFFITGTLKNWTIIDKLHKIKVPTLLTNGRFDEAQDEVIKPYFEKINKVRWVRFADSAHVSHLEETEEYVKVVKGFLSC